MFDLDINSSRSSSSLYRLSISSPVRNDAKVIQIGKVCAEVDNFVSLNISTETKKVQPLAHLPAHSPTHPPTHPACLPACLPA